MAPRFSAPTFIREHRGGMLREWEASVQAEAPIVDLKEAVLRDHIPEFLDMRHGDRETRGCAGRESPPSELPVDRPGA